MKYFLYCRKSTEREERQVMSLQSQQDAAERAFLNQPAIEVVEVLQEAMSAKNPGRPVFADMLNRIERGEADGIISWAPDRLARNSIDGGRIIYLLDTGTIRDLKFATYTFENNSQGKFMLSIMFGQSKYYSDALSDNVKRGNQTKIERGWRPNRAPLGYLNDPATKTIVPDPVLFSLIRRIFDMLIYEGRNPHDVATIVHQQWGLLTPGGQRSGRKPISRSTIYKMLANPFYKGEFEWNGQIYPGLHQAIVTPSEFACVQQKLNERSTPRPVRLSFAYTGMIRCATCSGMVTAERKTNRFGSKYIYYHCSSRGPLRNGCSELSVEEKVLTQTFFVFLESLRIREDVVAWVRGYLPEFANDVKVRRGQIRRVQIAAQAEIAAQLAEVTSLRLRRLIQDEEFDQLRRQLEARKAALDDIDNAEDVDLIEPFELLVKASKYAVDWIAQPENAAKRELLKIVGSNPTLGAKKLSIYATEPFFSDPELCALPRLLHDVEQVRTLTPRQIAGRGRRIVASLAKTLESEDGRHRFEVLRRLIPRLESPDNELPILPRSYRRAVSKVARRKRSDAAPSRSPRRARSDVHTRPRKHQ
ncbi:recombinase family protein [Sphingomonas sp. AOB5]|uniref:recombinase family protein n=1 Tax=Sphingomonas sp. AOB5 TaxID=3034017 RepID=UPI0023F90D49|nr:recombinase family protein [Sphingomonas sp. AOB5]MDF7774291.1 recombinase family protein [Sphingomonas sp. AOB5]